MRIELGKNRRRTARGAYRAGNFLLFLLALVTANVCLAASGRVLAAPASAVPSLGQLGWAIADFDGDSQPDVAVTKMEARGAGYVYWLELDLSTKRKDEKALVNSGLPAAGFSLFGVHLTPRDVDGDHKLDLVVTMGLNSRPVAVWINDGQGRFEEGDLAAYPGLAPAGDFWFVSPREPLSTHVVYDQGRRTRFLLLFARGLLRPDLRPDRCPMSSLGLPVSRLALEQAPARAPPSRL